MSYLKNRSIEEMLRVIESCSQDIAFYAKSLNEFSMKQISNAIDETEGIFASVKDDVHSSGLSDYTKYVLRNAIETEEAKLSMLRKNLDPVLDILHRLQTSSVFHITGQAR